jgi:hypothetical protein
LSGFPIDVVLDTEISFGLRTVREGKEERREEKGGGRTEGEREGEGREKRGIREEEGWEKGNCRDSRSMWYWIRRSRSVYER